MLGKHMNGLDKKVMQQLNEITGYFIYRMYRNVLQERDGIG